MSKATEIKDDFYKNFIRGFKNGDFHEAMVEAKPIYEEAYSGLTIAGGSAFVTVLTNTEDYWKNYNNNDDVVRKAEKNISKALVKEFPEKFALGANDNLINLNT